MMGASIHKRHVAALLEARDLVVHRNGKLVLQVDDFAVNEGEILAVIGPNGAGKSTLLLALARLLKPTNSQVYFQGKMLSDRDDLGFRRKIALVLQDPLLLDASVFNNVASGLRFRGIPRNEVKARAEEWLARLGITHLRDRPAHQLSGGEAQRVSLARAFALNPDILLLDEPFRALDAPTRARMLDDFQALLADTSLTVVFVTHDMDEALLLGDRVAVILEGKLRQIGTPEQVFSSPADLDVAALVGIETVLSGRVTAMENGHVMVDVFGVQIEAVGQVQPGRDALLLLRPEDVTLWMGDELPLSSARNHLTGKITRMVPQGPLVRVTVACLGCSPQKDIKVVSLITRTSSHQMGLSVNSQVTLTFKASAIHLIPR